MIWKHIFFYFEQSRIQLRKMMVRISSTIGKGLKTLCKQYQRKDTNPTRTKVMCSNDETMFTHLHAIPN